MGKFINKDELRSGCKDCIEIHFRNGHIPYSIIFLGMKRYPFNECFCFGPAMRLDIPDFDVNSLILPEMCRFQHLIRLPHTGNVTKENF